MSGEQRKAVIKNADMDEKMQQDAVDIASKALSEYNIEKVRKDPCRLLRSVQVLSNHSLLVVSFPRMLLRTSRRSLTASTRRPGTFRVVDRARVALLIPSRLSFTRRLLPPRFHRHVIVGRNFGSYVTHETKHFIYFYLGQVAVLLFKSG